MWWNVVTSGWPKGFQRENSWFDKKFVSDEISNFTKVKTFHCRVIIKWKQFEVSIKWISVMMDLRSLQSFLIEFPRAVAKFLIIFDRIVFCWNWICCKTLPDKLRQYAAWLLELVLCYMKYCTARKSCYSIN